MSNTDNLRNETIVGASPEIHFVATTSEDGRVTHISVVPNYGLFAKRLALFAIIGVVFTLVFGS